MSFIKNTVIDLLGKRETGHPWKRKASLSSLQDGATVAMLHVNNRLGDAMVQSAFIHGLRDHTQRLRTIVITTESYEQYWKSHPGCDEVIVLPQQNSANAVKRIVETRKFIKKYRARFDALVSFDLFCRIGTFYLISALRSRLVIGFSKETFRLFDYSIPSNLDGRNRRTPQDRVRDLLTLFGVQMNELELRFHAPTSNEPGINLRRSANKVFINAYAFSETRNFSPETVKRLSAEVFRMDTKSHIFLNVPTGDTRYQDILMNDDRFTILAPRKSLFELFDMIDDMDAVITPDTGIGHVAAALSKPLLVAFKDSYYGPLAWKPISNQLELVYSNTDHTVNDLDWTEVRACLNRTFARIERPELVKSK